MIPTRLARTALWLLLGSQLACATGRQDDPPPRRDGESSRDQATDSRPPDLPGDFWSWPDRARPDLSPPPDQLLPPDSAPPSCADVYEPDESCATLAKLGSVVEGSGWASRTATLNPGSDLDWYSADAQEKSHTCIPLTSQCFVFTVRLTVPAGRALQVCLRKQSCTATPTCQQGGSTLEVKYQVNGTCAYNDDTQGRILVRSTDGQGGCVPYGLSFRYDEC